MQREISIKSIILYVLKGWRLIIICMLLLGTVLGLRQYRVDKANAMASQNVVVQTPVDIMRNLSNDEMTLVKMALTYLEYYENAKDYVENSILLQLDYTNVDIAKLQFEIEAGENVSITTLLNAYTGYVDGGELAEDVIEALSLDIEPRYLTEVISVSVENCTANADGKLENGVLVLSIRYPEEETLRTIADAASVQIKLFEKEVDSKVGEHQVVLQTTNISKIFDQSLIKTQMERIDYYNVTASGYQRAIAGANANQLTVINSWNAIQEELQKEDESEKIENTPNESMNVAVGINMRMIVLGMLSGFFMAVIIKMLYYIGTTKIRGTADIRTSGIHVFGVMKHNSDKKKFGKQIDNLLYRFENGGVNCITPEEQLDLICSNIYLYCKNENINQIVLTSCVKSNKEIREIERIKEWLEERGIDGKQRENPMYHADALMLMASVKHVVFIENELKTNFEELNKSVELCRANGITVAGGVLLN